MIRFIAKLDTGSEIPFDAMTWEDARRLVERVNFRAIQLRCSKIVSYRPAGTPQQTPDLEKVPD